MKKNLVLTCLLFLFLSVFAGAFKYTNAFTERGKNHVRVETPGLFRDSSRIVLRLDTMNEQAYCFPLQNAKLISNYGGARNHSGIDMKTKANDTIRSVFDGIVRMSKPYAGYGNLVVIRHPNGLETVYSHNSKNLVKVGDLISAGQPIALTGRTGRATTEHLHLEFRINGQHFNPNLILNVNDYTLKKEPLVCTKNVGSNHIEIGRASCRERVLRLA